MEPVQYKPQPRDPADVAEAHAKLERFHAQRRAEAAANDVYKRALLLAGPALRDVDAAMQCMDSCHPRVRMEQHDGGATCHCQDTPEDKVQRRVNAKDALARLFSRPPDPEAEAERQWLREAFERAAADLEVEVKDWGGSVPFQIEGVVFGRSFYVRNRHEHFRIEVAPQDNPGMFVDADPQDWDEQWLIDEGAEETLFGGQQQDEVYALKYTVAKIKAFLFPAPPCPHVLTNEAGTIAFAYCPLCGYHLQHITGARS